MKNALQTTATTPTTASRRFVSNATYVAAAAVFTLSALWTAAPAAAGLKVVDAAEVAADPASDLQNIALDGASASAAAIDEAVRSATKHHLEEVRSAIVKASAIHAVMDGLLMESKCGTRLVLTAGQRRQLAQSLRETNAVLDSLLASLLAERRSSVSGAVAQQLQMAARFLKAERLDDLPGHDSVYDAAQALRQRMLDENRTSQAESPKLSRCF